MMRSRLRKTSLPHQANAGSLIILLPIAYSAVDREIFCHIGQTDPPTCSVFKLYQQFPSHRRRFPAACPRFCMNPSILHLYCFLIRPVVYNFLELSVSMSFIIALCIDIVRDQICGVALGGSIRELDLILSGIGSIWLVPTHGKPSSSFTPRTHSSPIRIMTSAVRY